MEISPSTTSQQADKPKHKPKSKRSSAMSDDGRTVVLTGFSSTFKIKQLKKACKKNGEIEQFIFPVEMDSQPTAHAIYKLHKDARKAANNLNGKTVKGEVLNAVLRSKKDKNLSQKSLKKSRLIVRNLPFKCSKELLTNKFSKFGEISEIVLPTKTVGKNKKKLGFAFVQFQNVFDAAKALESMNQKEIKGRPIAVDWTLPKKKYELLKVSEEVPKGKIARFSSAFD
jgi:nucleolar protein 4